MYVSWRQHIPAQVSMRMSSAEVLDVYLPPRRVALQILALPLKHTCPYFCSCRMLTARIGDVLHPTQGQCRVDEVRVRSDKLVPLVVLLHGDGTGAQCFYSSVRVVALTSEYASNGVESFLDLTNNNRLEFPTGSLEVEVGLCDNQYGVHICT